MNLRRGLPVTGTTADPVLLALRGVIARAVDPDDDASCTAALDDVLRGLLARFHDARYAEAARALFGLPPARPGQNLTVRRELAAGAAGHEVHHFRKRVEPRLVAQLASALLADADRFTRSRVIAPRLAPVPRRQVVPADPFAWEVAEHEEALSRLWAAIYAARRTARRRAAAQPRRRPTGDHGSRGHGRLALGSGQRRSNQLRHGVRFRPGRR